MHVDVANNTFKSLFIFKHVAAIDQNIPLIIAQISAIELGSKPPWSTWFIINKPTKPDKIEQPRYTVNDFFKKITSIKVLHTTVR